MILEFAKNNNEVHSVFLETAHPSKFLDIVENVIQEKVELPYQIQSILNKEKTSIKINDYKDLKNYLLSK